MICALLFCTSWTVVIRPEGGHGGGGGGGGRKEGGTAIMRSYEGWFRHSMHQKKVP